jgi:5'-methylthioadenosine nucleosidase
MTGTQAIKRVVLIVAMEQEADPFIRKHGLQQMTPSPFMTGMQMVCYTGRIGGNGNDKSTGNNSNNSDTNTSTSSIEVFLVWTGRDQRYKVNNVATTAASVATYASIQAFQPVDLVLSAGTAGGFAAVGGQVGDVYLSTKCVFHNRRIPYGGTDTNTGHSTYEEYGFGHFRSPSLPLLAATCGLKQGVVSTSDSLDHSPIDLELMRGEGAAVKEMEAAAVAWVCQQVQPAIPFLAVKSITDIVDSGTETVDEEFYANLKTASLALQEKLSQILQLLSQKPLAHWSGASPTPTGDTGTVPTPAVAVAVPARGVRVPKGVDANRNNNNNKKISSTRFTEALPLLAAASIGVLFGVRYSKRGA